MVMLLIFVLFVIDSLASFWTVVELLKYKFN